MNNVDEDDLKLVSCTPIMAKRNLRPDVPETPFIKQTNRFENTPFQKGGINIQKAEAPKAI